MHDHDNLFPDSGHPAFRVQCSGECGNLLGKHVQVQAFSDEWPVPDPDNLLPDSGRPDFCVHYPGYCKNLQRQHAQVQAFSDEWPVRDLDNLCLTQVTQLFVYRTQVTVGT